MHAVPLQRESLLTPQAAEQTEQNKRIYPLVLKLLQHGALLRLSERLFLDGFPASGLDIAAGGF